MHVCIKFKSLFFHEPNTATVVQPCFWCLVLYNNVDCIMRSSSCIHHSNKNFIDLANSLVLRYFWGQELTQLLQGYQQSLKSLLKVFYLIICIKEVFEEKLCWNWKISYYKGGRECRFCCRLRKLMLVQDCAKNVNVIVFLFKDLCQLVNADAPYWLVGMTEMTRTFGLELLESVLNDFPQVFLQVSSSPRENRKAFVHMCSNICTSLTPL